jgi:hypothetical protein
VLKAWSVAMRRLTGFALLLLPAIALAQPAGKGQAPAAAPGKGAEAAAPQAAPAACPGSMVGRPGNAALTCACPAGSGAGTVWGSGPYTADSTICAAALHAGAIPAAGGTVTVRPMPGRPSYAASSRNGVTTMSYGSYGASFHFDGVPIATGPEPCPDTMMGVSSAQPLTCTCPAGAAAGTVWGSGPYTADSAVCTAARHAGVINQAGGTVTLRAAPGQQRYAASSRNGVTTLSYGSYGASFQFSAPAAAGK